MKIPKSTHSLASALLSFLSNTTVSTHTHRAADWPKDPVWTGKVKITARGQKATIFLLDAATNANFATCHVEEGSVERGAVQSRVE